MLFLADMGVSSYIDEIRGVEFRENDYEGSIYLEGLKPSK